MIDWAGWWQGWGPSVKLCVCVCVPLASKEECCKGGYLLMMWIRSAQIRALERPPTSLTDIIMEMKKETSSQETFKIEQVLICWLFLTLCLQRLSDLHIHSAVITFPVDLCLLTWQYQQLVVTNSWLMWWPPRNTVSLILRLPISL